MKFLRAAMAAGLLAACAGQPASAATGNVLFNGTITATCTITINSNGTMTVSSDLQSLSSHNAGGSAGSAQVDTTGGVTLSVDPVTSTTVPASDVTATTWTPTFATTGAQTISETGTATALTAPGTSTVAVNLAGTKSGSNRFSAGNYQATVTLRCE
ncbi:MAG: hypothetical protein E5W38_08890 [Mesorhizobium sp.]|uniref:hypothetical protein n=1 Tax=Mesorhizobium sp. TaxID=1871066 RepID=UPI000FE54D8F|nr:hypothetical protein [Mesorhizobium sp.]RWB61338.1 MAG: hypothetical protein EOQ47_00380 [Mesorhizobium sp.]TIU33559.1 MAG: hypothetical protein E5W38_08890 [Mesorhizobium sp.]TKB15516.1 MAG: hypothetical protein E5V75_16160 [Mesorhizobium sp.]